MEGGRIFGVNQPVPYCGPAPLPSQVWGAWNLDPFALAVVVALTMLSALSLHRHRIWIATAVFAVSTLLLISPLCALTTALFSVRVTHHFILMTVLAPLLTTVFRTRSAVSSRLPPEMAFIFHTLIFWFWHIPPGYAFALNGMIPYWIMQAGLLASAIWLWAILLSPRTSVFTAVALALATVAQMGMLAAILTLSRAPLFAAHLDTTQAFGLEPLQDQQIAGVIMWTVGLLPYLIVALMRLYRGVASRDGKGSWQW
jgi:putative membrane protein